MKSEVPSPQEQILVKIGGLLLVLQATEYLINVAMLYVFQDNPPMSIATLEAQKKTAKKKTLGYFITALRKRVDLHPHFDKLMSSFLDDRNEFIHDLCRVPGRDIETKEGRQKLDEFLAKLLGENMQVTRIFVAFIDAWAKQVGIDKNVRDTCPDLYTSDFYRSIQTT